MPKEKSHDIFKSRKQSWNYRKKKVRNLEIKTIKIKGNGPAVRINNYSS